MKVEMLNHKGVPLSMGELIALYDSALNSTKAYEKSLMLIEDVLTASGTRSFQDMFPGNVLAELSELGNTARSNAKFAHRILSGEFKTYVEGKK